MEICVKVRCRLIRGRSNCVKIHTGNAPFYYSFLTQIYSRSIMMPDRRKSTGMFQRSISTSDALAYAATGSGTDDKGKSVDKTRVTRALFSSPTKEMSQAGISERHKRLKVSYFS